VGVLYRSASERFALAANYRLARDAVDSVAGTVVALEDYDVLDVSLTYDLSNTLELYGRVQNATDESYQEISGFNAAERSTYGGVRLRF
jgi:vitamin B12 transporter